jgi:hypothetical protein
MLTTAGFDSLLWHLLITDVVNKGSGAQSTSYPVYIERDFQWEKTVGV